MRADGKPPRRGPLDGPAGAVEIVAAVHGPQRPVRGGLDAVLHGHVTVARDVAQQVERRPVHAVGARADDDARHVGVRERLAVERAEPSGRRVGVGIGLEIDQVALRRAVAVAVEVDPLGDLPRDALPAAAVGGREGPVVAERAAAPPHRAVAVGARETRIDREFLHPAAEQPAEIARIGVEPPRIAPRVDRPLRHYSRFLESIQIVTGPSFTSATCMSAPKRPVATGRPDSSATRAAKRS